MLQGLSGAKEPTLLLFPGEASKRPEPLDSTSNMPSVLTSMLSPTKQQEGLFFVLNYLPPAFATSVT